MSQSAAITRIGCVGLVLVLGLLLIIGAMAVRMDLARKRASALAARARVCEQVKKAPGVLQRMLAFDCGKRAEDAVGSLGQLVDSLGYDSTTEELNSAWNEIDRTWAGVNRGCASKRFEQAYTDLETEMEGLRNRFSVEKDNYIHLAEIYNSALRAFPGSAVASGFEEL